MEGRNAENYVPPFFLEKAGDNKVNIQIRKVMLETRNLVILCHH